MSTTDPKKIAFRGTTNRDLQKHIDSYFTTLGGINLEGLNYTSSNYYYFIDNSGEIIRVTKLPVGYTEREPGDYFKDSLGGIKNKRKFAFLGSEYPEIQEAMINFFVKLGATNRQKLLCRYKDMYYFIDETNNIDNSLILPGGYIRQLQTYLNVMKNQEEKIPEYVECVEEQPQHNNYGELGKIYKVLDWNCSITDCMLVGTTSGSTAKKRFKPSTKEAYDTQNTYLKAAEYIPQVGDYVVMEKAGGWGYSPDNNGCLALVSRVEERTINGFKSSSIWGEVINPNNNNSRSVKFSDIPQFGYNKEVIFRKALPHEIPGSNIKVEPQQQVEEPKESLTKEKGELERRTQYPITPENAFPVKAIKKQIKKNKFQEVHEIKTVEEKLLKKTKSKLFNI